jgi:hypothetical protein
MFDMKKNFYTLAILALLLPSWVRSQGCIHTTMFPNDTLSATTNWQSIDTCSFAGEFSSFEVVSGNQYIFSTSLNDGSNVLYDSQLTLVNESDSILAYNDDLSNSELQSRIEWTADFSGIVQLHVSEYDCMPNSICSVIRYRELPPLAITDMVDEHNFMLYPNPASHVLSVSGVQEACTFEVISSNGKIVQQGKLTSSEPSILVDRFPGGMYLLKLSTDQKAQVLRFSICRNFD